MASGLLKRRIGDTRIAALGVVVLLFLSAPILSAESLAHGPIESLGPKE